MSALEWVVYPLALVSAWPVGYCIVWLALTRINGGAR